MVMGGCVWRCAGACGVGMWVGWGVFKCGERRLMARKGSASSEREEGVGGKCVSSVVVGKMKNEN